MKTNALAVCVAMLLFATAAETAQAQNYRQYYGSWNYQPQRRYYARSYYYKPKPSYSGYQYHYCIHYPTKPRYVYYYNPHRRQYWGRFDLEGKEGEQYSLLKQEDRKEKLEDIPESAFPKPGAMPVIPESEDMIQIDPPPGLPGKDLPE